MASKKLNEKEIAQLLSQYRSERRRLLFQLERVRSAMRDLKAGLETGTVTSSEEPVKRGPGRPKGSTNVKKAAPKKKPGRRKKRTITGGGYRLNEWDQVVMNAIDKQNMLLPKEDLHVAVMEFAKKSAPEMTEEEVQAKLTRVLQKLSGKRGVLGTHRSGLRRGYHYGLKDWFFESSGLLRKQHYDKLVLIAEPKAQ